jgi:apolipoprotein D and lipocalin family protein
MPLKKNAMSPTPHTDSAHSPKASGLPHGMDALAYEIARVERRLIAREVSIQHRLQDIQHGARAAIRPRKSMVPWAGVLLMLWPLLPRFLRPRLSPASTITVFGMAAPAMKRLMTNHPAGPATVPDLDIARYMGRWQEVVCLSCQAAPQGVGPSTVHFELSAQPDGTPWVTVLQHALSPSGRMRESRGVMRVVPGSGGARMKQSFLASWMRWWPGAWDDHWVLHVDQDYTEALVGDAGRRQLRVLSRDGLMDLTRLAALMDLAQGLGYDTQKMNSATRSLR